MDLVRRGLLLVVVPAIILSAAPAVAQEDGGGGPMLGNATVTVKPGAEGARVLEELQVEGAGGRIEHILPRTRDGDLGPLSVRTNGRELRVERERGEMLDKIYVPVPEGAGGEFEYEIAFTASGGEESARIPLVVPAVPTADDTSNVTLEFAVPEGRYLYESFPVVEADGGGAAATDMTSFPSFASYEMGTSPGGFLTSSNMYTALALVVIVGSVVGLLLHDRRSARSEVASA